MKLLSKLFRKADPAWWADAPRIFKDSAGAWYRRYTDEMLLPILRMEQLQITTREISNRIDDRDISAFLENHESILLSDKKPDEKLRTLGQHVHNLRERLAPELLPPDLLMKLVCITYIREDQDPFLWDETFEKDKHTQLMKDYARGGVRDFFTQVGLSGFLPSLEGLQSDMKRHLAKSQELADKFREQEKAVRNAVTSS